MPLRGGEVDMKELVLRGQTINGPDVDDSNAMEDYRNKFSKVEFSKHLKVCQWEAVTIKYIEEYKNQNDGNLSFMDVGGRNSEYECFARGFDKYNVLEVDKNAKGKNLIYGDICSCSTVPDNSYDIVFSRDVFEHIKEPWLAAEECVRITKNGGLNLHITLFSWRWHPCPVDMYRYTHQGLSFLFERTKKMDILFAGYDLNQRRNNLGRGKMKDKIDAVPHDDMDGFRENWRVVFVGKKND